MKEEYNKDGKKQDPENLRIAQQTIRRHLIRKFHNNKIIRVKENS